MPRMKVFYDLSSWTKGTQTISRCINNNNPDLFVRIRKDKTLQNEYSDDIIVLTEKNSIIIRVFLKLRDIHFKE